MIESGVEMFFSVGIRELKEKFRLGGTELSFLQMAEFPVVHVDLPIGPVFSHQRLSVALVFFH